MSDSKRPIVPVSTAGITRKFKGSALILTKDNAAESKDSPPSIASSTASLSASSDQSSPGEALSSGDDRRPSNENSSYEMYKNLLANTLKCQVVGGSFSYTIDLERLKNQDDGLNFSLIKAKAGRPADRYEMMRIDGYFGAVRQELEKQLEKNNLHIMRSSPVFKIFSEGLIELVPNANDNGSRMFGATMKLNSSNKVEIVIDDNGTGIQNNAIMALMQNKIKAAKQVAEYQRQGVEGEEVVNYSSMQSDKGADQDKAGGAGMGFFLVVDKITQVPGGDISLKNKEASEGGGLRITLISDPGPEKELNKDSTSSWSPSSP